MKKLLPVFFLFVSVFVFAQENIKQTIKDKSKSDKDRLVMEITSEMWLTKPDSIKIKGTSRGFGMYWMVTDLDMGNSNFSFSFGLGVFASNIFMDKTALETDSMTYFPTIAGDFKKHKIVTTYLELPIELRYRSKPDKTNNGFKFAIGFKGGLLVGSHTKMKAKDALGDLTVYKNNNIKHLNQYRYGPTLKFGYGSFNITAYYSLAALFNKNKGPEIVPFSVGLLISEF